MKDWSRRNLLRASAGAAVAVPMAALSGRGTTATAAASARGGDLAGFPNGRRVFDNVVAIELRAVAGASYPLVDPTFVPDGASGVLTDLTDGPNPPNTVSYLKAFPYLDHPVSGYRVVPLSVSA